MRAEATGTDQVFCGECGARIRTTAATAGAPEEEVERLSVEEAERRWLEFCERRS